MKIDEQIKEEEAKKKETEHNPKNFGRLEQHLSSIGFVGVGDVEDNEGDNYIN